MATNRSDYVVEINGDPSGLDRATQAASKRISAFGASTKKAFAGFGDQIFSLRGAIGSIAAGFSFKAIIDATVAAERASAQLDATLRSTRNAAGLNREELLRMAAALAQVTTVEDDAVVGAQSLLLTFTRIGREVFPQALEAILDVSTAMGTDLKSAALQVGKALNDPVKGAAALAEAGIQFTDVQKDQIKALVESGRVVEAQRIVLAELETQFGGSARAARDTFGGALAALKNTAGDLLEGEGGNLSDATEAVNTLTETLQTPEVKAGFATFTGGVITLVEWLAKLAGGAATAAKAVGEFFGELAVGSTEPFQNEIDRLTASIANTERQMAAAKFLRFPVDQYVTDIARYRAELDKLRAQQADFQNMGVRTPTLTPAAPSPSGTAPPPPAPIPVSSAEANKAAQAARQRAQAVASAEAAVFKAQLDRSRASLEALNAQNLLSLRDYHAQKLQLELDAIDRELEARRTAQATATDAERVRMAGEIEALGIQRVAAIEASGRELMAAEKQLGDERLALEERLLEATGRGAEAQAAAIEREFAELIARLRAQGDEAGVAIAIELKGVELARAQFETLEAELAQAQDGYQRRLQEIDVAVATGASTRSRARRDQIAAAEALVMEEERLADALQVQAEIIGDPALLGRVRDLRTEILITGQVTSDTINQVRGLSEDALGGFFDDIQDDPKDFADAVDNMLGSIEQSTKRLISQRLSEQLVDSLFGGLTGGGAGGGGNLLDSLISGAVDFFGGGVSSSGVRTTANIGHSGAVIGRPGPSKSVPAITFADAQRFHGGGMLGADEVPFIGLKGERVLNREETRDYNNRTAPMSVTVNIQTQDVQSFRRNETEVRARIGDAIRSGQRNR